MLNVLNGNISCGLTHRKHSLWVSLCSHVGVVNLLQNHPAFVVFAILCVKKETSYFVQPSCLVTICNFMWYSKGNMSKTS